MNVWEMSMCVLYTVEVTGISEFKITITFSCWLITNVILVVGNVQR
jgi:hypothetical protein